jgi:hypothetical protein
LRQRVTARARDPRQFRHRDEAGLFSADTRKRQLRGVMSYRIQVRPEAGALLRTLAPYVVLRLGRALAELADSIGATADGGVQDLCVDNCVVQFVVNHANRLLEVVHVEQREPVLPELYSLNQ